MRKPYESTYTKVLEMLGIRGEETLFIDDSPVNIGPAVKAGIHTHLLKADETLQGIGLL
jgi:HAD superfamily hydrolase (TIGR01509 family)